MSGYPEYQCPGWWKPHARGLPGWRAHQGEDSLYYASAAKGFRPGGVNRNGVNAYSTPLINPMNSGRWIRRND